MGFGQKIVSITLSPTTATNGDEVFGTVTISKTATATTLQLSSSDTTAAQVPQYVIVGGLSSEGRFTVTVGVVHEAVDVVIKATDPFNRSVSTTLRVDPSPLRLLKLAISPETIEAPNIGTGTVTIGRLAPSGGFVVNLSTAQSCVSIPASVTVPAGAKTATFPIKAAPVSAIEVATIEGKDANDFMASATQRVAPATVRVDLVLVRPETVTAANTVQGTVGLSAAAPQGGFTVTLSCSQPFLTVPQAVTIKAGSRSEAFAITTLPVSAAGVATITATDSNSYSSKAKLTVDVPAVRLTGLSFSPATVQGGKPSTGTVTLSAPAPADGFAITMSATLGPVTLSKTVKVPAGATSATFRVTTSSVTDSKTVTITGVDKNGYAASGSLIINPA